MPALTEDFTGTNGAALNGRTSTTGGVVCSSNGATISSNHGQFTNGTYALWDCGSADHQLEATLAAAANNAALLFGLDASGNGYGLYTISNYVHLIRVAAYVATQDPLSEGSGSSTWDNPIAPGNRFKVVRDGTTLTVYRDPGTGYAQIIQRTGVSTTTGSRAGLANLGGGGAAEFDDLAITPIAVASFAIDRDNVLTGSGTVTLTITGINTAWTGSPFTLSGSPPTDWSISSQSVTSSTSATVTLTRGTGTGTLTLTDGTLSDTVTATITATAVATGNWSAATTWDGKSIPAAGNTAVIPAGLTVTVDSNAAVGTSPSDTTTAALTCTGSGSLTVGDGVTFTVRGNVSVDNGVLAVGTGATGGAVLEFDSSGAATATIAGPTPATPTTPASALSAIGTSATRYYKMTSLTAAGESTAGAEVSATTPAGGGPHFAFALAWSPVAGATGYRIYRATTSGGQGTSPALVATLAGSETQWIDYGIAAASGAVPGSNSATTRPRYQCVIGGNAKTASRFRVRGVVGNRAIVRAAAAGGNAQISVTDGLYDVADASFVRVGDYASDALAVGVVGATTGTHAWTRCVLDSACGRIKVNNSLPAGMGFTLDYVTHKSLGNNLLMSGSAMPVTGNRRLKGCVFLGYASFAVEGMGVGGAAAGDETLFLRAPSASSFTGRATLTNCLIRHTGDPSNDYEPLSLWRLGDWDEVAIFGDASDYDGNGRYTTKRATRDIHWTTPAGGPAGTYAVSNSLCESFGMDSDDRTLDAADGDFDYGPAGGAISAFNKFLMIPQDRDSSSVPASPACTATNMAGTGSTYDHCTCYNGQQGFIALCESSDGTAGQITSCKSNIVWNDASQAAGAFNAILYIDNPTYAANLATFPTADVVASGAADYNCFFNGNTSRNFAGAPGYQYKRSAGATVPGAHDLVGVDPQFTDKTVRFWRWVKGLIGSNVIPAPASGGSSLTVASDAFMGGQTAGNGSPPATGWRDYCAWGLYKLSLKNEPTHADYDARYTLAVYKAFVRAGFTPTNNLLRNAGHDGVTIGAFDLPPFTPPSKARLINAGGAGGAARSALVNSGG